MHDLSDAQLVAAFLAHVQPRGDLTQAEAAETLSRLGDRKVHQTTVSRWVGQGAKRLESHTRHAIERYLRGEAAQPEDPDQEDEWLALSMEMVRMAGGNGQQWSEEQQRLIKLDVLEGLIRLGVGAGKDVRRLQDYQRELQAAGPGVELGERAPPARPSSADLLQAQMEVHRMESEAALNRSIGLKHLGRAAELEAEESRARRESFPAEREISEAELALVETRVRAEVDALRRAEAGAQRPAPAPASAPESAPQAPAPDGRQ